MRQLSISAQANKQLGLTLIAEFEKAVSLLSENPEFRDVALTTGIGGNNDYAYQVKQVRNVILKYKLGVGEDQGNRAMSHVSKIPLNVTRQGVPPPLKKGDRGGFSYSARLKSPLPPFFKGGKNNGVTSKLGRRGLKKVLVASMR